MIVNAPALEKWEETLIIAVIGRGCSAIKGNEFMDNVKYGCEVFVT